jgi:hypothetical protein
MKVTKVLSLIAMILILLANYGGRIQQQINENTSQIREILKQGITINIQATPDPDDKDPFIQSAE